jgi:hypothetical protein
MSCNSVGFALVGRRPPLALKNDRRATFKPFLKATLVALNATKVALRKGVLVAAVPPVPGATL